MNWPPDVQGFPREYFSILSGKMQLVRTWHRLDFMLYYRYKKRETTDGRSHLSQLRNNRFSLVAMGGYFFLLKEMIVNIITVKAVRNIPICVKSLSVMYTASPPFKVQRTYGRWIDRLTSKVSLVDILAYYRGKCNLSGLDNSLILCYIIDTKRGKRQTVAPWIRFKNSRLQLAI